MKWYSKLCVIILAAGLCMFTVSACGGGGTGFSETVNYSGETQAAVIDTTSAVQLALNATVGTKDSGEYGGATPMSVGMPGSEGGLSLVQDPGQAVEIVREYMNFDVSPQPLDVSSEPLSVECDTMHLDTGSAGGTVSLKICAEVPDIYTETRYWISAAFIFDEYDDSTYYQDGQLEVQGTFDETIGLDGDFDGQVTVIFRDLVTIDSSSGEDSYVDGWALYLEGSGTVSITYNMCVIDSAAGKSYWMDDYDITIDYADDEVTLSGRFYDSVAGYVDLTTETVLSWDIDMDADGELVYNSDHPTAGAVKLTGADGYWIKITFTSTGYYIQINYTGDDAVDITLPSIGEYPWI